MNVGEMIFTTLTPAQQLSVLLLSHKQMDGYGLHI
jgi:hypothetical protein